MPQAPVEANIQKLAVLYIRYAGAHQGKSPADAEALKKFAQGLDAEALASMDINDVSAVFVSPRDNQPYVVAPSTSAAPMMGSTKPPIVIYEQTGVGGKRYVADSLGGYREVDEAEFSQIKPK